MSQSILNNNNNSFNNTNSFNNVWNNCTVADDRSQLLTWLSPLEPRLRHQDIKERRVENVGQWLMQTEVFRKWYDRRWEGGGENAVLFCYGDPGVGKTFISSLVVDWLCDQAGGQNSAVACLYYDFAARKEQSATRMLASLLKQMVSGMKGIPDEILRAYEEQKMVIGGRAPGLPDIVKMLETITSSQRTFICIDALDECAAVYRVKLLDSLKQILVKSPGTRIFMTGRPHIRAEIEKRLPGRVISVSVTPSQDDILRYLRVKLEEDETPDAMDESLRKDIMRKIPENISEMFLLVSLNIEAILQESTIYRRREKLSRMTDGLGLADAYGATMERVKAQGGDKSRLGMAVLMWIAHAERPLRADELCHALAVVLGSTNFNADNIPSMLTLVSCCQGLITVDKEASTVRLIHFTLQEYFSAHSDIFSRPHSTMAEVCLTYLNSQRVEALSADPSPDIQGTPFLEYCSVYWGVHAKRQLSDCATSLALDLLREHYDHIFTKFLLVQAKHVSIWSTKRCFPFSGLHCASFFGITRIVTALIETGSSDINGRDVLGYTPLTWAARNGHEEVVKLLLGREEVDPDWQEKEGQTPLWIAARSGHEGVVRILLGRQDVSPNKPDASGDTPLIYAAMKGHEGLVKILLKREEVDPDKPDYSGETPLLYATKKGHEGVVKILLGREKVNPDKPNNYGNTPLALAAWSGHEGIVGILLGREEVNPDRSNKYGRTPLSFAAERGHEGVVKILLGRQDVNPDKPDTSGNTPLSLAGWSGHEGVVTILLGREEVNPDKPNNSGYTPPALAAWNGHEGVVKILLGRKEVNPDQPNNYGSTPLALAAKNGHEGVVKILLEREEVNPDKPNNYGDTPLTLAIRRGHEGVVGALLGREEVNPDKPDNYGTPLALAAMKGRGDMVEILLGREEVNPDKPNNCGETQLALAARMGHERVVKMLLRREEVNPNKPDSFGQTPLMIAASLGHNRVVALLQSHKEVTLSRVDA